MHCFKLQHAGSVSALVVDTARLRPLDVKCVCVPRASELRYYVLFNVLCMARRSDLPAQQGGFRCQERAVTWQHGLRVGDSRRSHWSGWSCHGLDDPRLCSPRQPARIGVSSSLSSSTQAFIPSQSRFGGRHATLANLGRAGWRPGRSTRRRAIKLKQMLGGSRLLSLLPVVPV